MALFGTESSKRTPRLSGKRPTARFSLFSPPTFIHSIIAWLAMPQRATDARCLAGFFCVFRGNAAPTPSQTRPSSLPRRRPPLLPRRPRAEAASGRRSSPTPAPPPRSSCCSAAALPSLLLHSPPLCRAAALPPLLQRCRPPFPAAAPPSARPCCRAAALPCCCCAGPMPLWPAHPATGAGVEPGTRCSVVEPAATQPREEDWRRDKDDRVGKKVGKESIKISRKKWKCIFN